MGQDRNVEIVVDMKEADNGNEEPVDSNKSPDQGDSNSDKGSPGGKAKDAPSEDEKKRAARIGELAVALSGERQELKTGKAALVETLSRQT